MGPPPATPCSPCHLQSPHARTPLPYLEHKLLELLLLQPLQVGVLLPLRQQRLRMRLLPPERGTPLLRQPLLLLCLRADLACRGAMLRQERPQEGRHLGGGGGGHSG